MFKFIRRKKEIPVKTWTIPNSEGLIDPELEEMTYYKGFDGKSVAIIGTAGGYPVFVDLATAPHILVAGATGSGKSVCINTILTSILLKNSPNDLHLYIIDPKKVDYISWDIPHVKKYASSVADASAILEELSRIMDARFSLMQAEKVADFTDLIIKLPRVLLVFDEFASMMSKEGKKEILPKIEELARLGRPCGVHLLLATQRPDRQSISGQLKANCPTRICFRVQSNTDSRIILDQSGGEKLAGRGDGLLLDSAGNFQRFQGLMCSQKQKDHVIDWWKVQK